MEKTVIMSGQIQILGFAFIDNKLANYQAIYLLKFNTAPLNPTEKHGNIRNSLENSDTQTAFIGSVMTDQKNLGPNKIKKKNVR